MLPFEFLIDNIFDDGEYIILRCTDLCGAVSFAKGDGGVFYSLEVYSDSEGRAEFVVSGVPTADGL